MSKKSCFVTFFSIVLACVLCSVCFSETGSSAQRIETLYGQAVHAFFGHDYQETVDLLGDVVKMKSEDPRVYFFLGLAHRRLGDNKQAERYFKQAARFELTGFKARDYQISEVLRRIQGTERQIIEKYRQQARQEWQEEEKQRRQILYGEQKAQDRAVLEALAKTPTAPNPSGGSSPIIGRARFGARTVDPFAPARSAGVLKAGTEEEMIATTQAAAPEVDTSKLLPAKAPAKRRSAAPQATDEDSDPFGEEEENDPFAEDEEATPESGEEEMDEDDPFAAFEAETESKEQSSGEETGAEADPFE